MVIGVDCVLLKMWVTIWACRAPIAFVALGRRRLCAPSSPTVGLGGAATKTSWPVGASETPARTRLNDFAQ